MSSLLKQINIGKILGQKLGQIGLHSIEELRELGSEQAFIRIKTMDTTACINTLYALEGAVQAIRWHALAKDRKEELLVFFRMIEKSEN